MRKKTFLVLLALCMLLMSICPVGALAEGEKDVPITRAPATFKGGLVYDAFEQAYYMVGECNGEVEYKTLTVALYKQVGTGWEFVDSEVTSGYSARLIIDERVNTELTSGQYKVVVSITTPTHTASTPFYYSL